ncbi:MAG: hypothetical protein GEV13_04095 [Rhodospirillales bacterium]|nr:hypothetical protein [Rhodospirillales bacterium]
MTKPHAEKFAKNLDRTAKQGRGSDEALCYIKEGRKFGPKHLLRSIAHKEEKVLEITGASVDFVSAEVAKAYDVFDNWYAPICVLVDGHSGEAISLGFYSFLITDPFEWSQRVPELIGKHILPEDVEFKVLADDSEVDAFLLTTFESSRRVLVDPMVDSANGSIRGIEIVALADLEAEAEAKGGL